VETGGDTMANDIATLSFDRQEKAAFLNAQYVALRQELENAKQRAFYLYALGAIIVPATQQLLQYLTSELSKNVSFGGINLAFKLTVIKIVFPFLVISIIFLFLAENKGIKRCGRYIKENVEAHFNTVDNVLGWETWLGLEKNLGPQYAAFSFIILFALYYLVFVTAGLLDIYINWSLVAAIIAGVFYVLIWLATQCYFVHEIWYDDPKYGNQCPVYKGIFIDTPGYMRSKVHEMGALAHKFTHSIKIR
jgi:hypothetical protein